MGVPEVDRRCGHLVPSIEKSLRVTAQVFDLFIGIEVVLRFVQGQVPTPRADSTVAYSNPTSASSVW
jgi:hypothetical protein